MSEARDPEWARSIDAQKWVEVGAYGSGVLLLNDHPKRCEVMHRWPHRNRYRQTTLLTCYGPEAYALAMTLAKFLAKPKRGRPRKGE